MKNILFIVTDDQRFNTIHALGNPDIITPHLDKLAHMGTAFTQAHIPCGTSGAVCMPSRAMLHTGRTLFHIQAEGQDIPKEHVTIAETLKAAGYECFGTGKWHNGPPAFARGFTTGSNIFFGGMWDHWNVPVSYFDPTGQYDNEINFVADFAHNHIPRRIHCDKFNAGVHSSTLLTDSTLAFLQQRDKEKPFFAYLSYLAPHDPRTMPAKYKDMYNPQRLTLPPNCMCEYPFLFGVENIRDETLVPYPRTEAMLREELADYYAMITHLDDEIGRVLNALESQNMLENTLVVFTSDNGLAVGGHALMGKQNHYEESIRVPLIFAGQGIPCQQQSDAYVYLLDIFPTLCELLGLQTPSSVEGKSFAQLFAQPNGKARESLYFAYNDIMRSVNADGFKLIEYCGKIRKTQLFDLQKDPYELADISVRQPNRLRQMREYLSAYKAEWEDTSHQYSAAFWENYTTNQCIT